jgi:hypothetical protein
LKAQAKAKEQKCERRAARIARALAGLSQSLSPGLQRINGRSRVEIANSGGVPTFLGKSPGRMGYALAVCVLDQSLTGF